MNLVSLTPAGVNLVLTYPEYELISRYVLHAAETDKDMTFNHPELLAEVRSLNAQIELAFQEGFLDE
jgi:hypothetical protein